MTSLTAHKTLMRVPRFVRVVFAMIMREMATSYGRSALGYFWAILEPIGAIAILTFALSFALSSPPLGDNFPLFYATGYIPFMFYNAMQNKVSNALRENVQLLFYPRVTYMDVFLSRFILIMLTQFLVAAIVFGGTYALNSMQAKIGLVEIVCALLIAGILGLGVGVLNAVLIYFLPSWRQFWSILTRPLFLMSCIFFLYDTLPVWAKEVLWYNPLIHIIGMTRMGFYSTYRGDYISPVFPLLVGVICLLIGLVVLRRYARDLING